MSILPDTSHDSNADGPTYPEQLKADLNLRTKDKAVDRIMTFVAHLLAKFDATDEAYDPIGKGNDPGYLAGYLKKIQTKELDIPAKYVKGDSMKIMKYIMNLPEQNVGIMWRRAKRYNVVAEWQLRD